MRDVEQRLLQLSNLLVGATGLIYAAFRYLVKPSDPFAVVNHPLQPLVQHLHVLTAPLLVFAVGAIWRAHVTAQLRQGNRERRASGLSMLVAFVPMAASGYLLQTATDPTWRGIWVGVHLAASGLWLLGFLAHQLASGARSDSDL